jgi:alpha-L-fucosidase
MPKAARTSFINNVELAAEMSRIKPMKAQRFILVLCNSLITLAALAPAPLRGQSAAPRHQIAPGPFEPTWQSLAADYRCPDWFRDAKFGIWAHWSAQCVPEQGDWYARHMYIQGHPQYDYHARTYGHPTHFGFMELDNLWKADKWEPEKLMDLYVRAGARYFVALANHHDNFDAYDSKHHAWNSVNVGPKRDIVGTWAKAARDRGLRFGVSNHSSHAWHWFQTAYSYDAEGERAGARYDAFTLKKPDGAGKWWDGLDPQELYTGRNIVIPDGLTDRRGAARWHEENTRPWTERAPEMNPQFTEKWFLRAQDLIDKYRPDLVYLDNTGDLPLGQAGLDLAAHYYNASRQWHAGKLEAVLNVKGIDDHRRSGIVGDIERGVAPDILPQPWQTCSCIGEWHYSRGVAERNQYKSVNQVVDMLVDIVSKNGNLLLSIPIRGDGTIDDREVAFLEGLAKWMSVNGDAIFGTRPWRLFGEGPTRAAGGMFAEGRRLSYTGRDFRFTATNGTLYAIALDWPGDEAVITSLSAGAGGDGEITRVELLGHGQPLEFSRDAAGLKVKLPSSPPGEHAFALRIIGLRME